MYYTASTDLITACLQFLIKPTTVMFIEMLELLSRYFIQEEQEKEGGEMITSRERERERERDEGEMRERESREKQGNVKRKGEKQEGRVAGFPKIKNNHDQPLLST